MTVMSDTGFIENKNKQTNDPIHFYDLHYTDSDVLRYTDYDSDLVLRSNTYRRYPIRHEEVSESVKGEVPKVKLTVGNVDRVMQYYLESYNGLRGKRVDVMTSFKSYLDDDQAVLRDIYYIDTARDSEEAVEFVLLPEFDLMSIQLPCRIYNRRHCAWEFKDSDCKYVGSVSDCDRTIEACEENGNILNFGAFPSVPSRKIFYE